MDDYGPSDVRAGDVLYEEPGDTNDDEDDLSNVEIADILYTRDWTSISTDDDADAFVVDLLQHATPNERAYISNIYLGKWNGSNALKIIRDKIVAMRTYLADLEARAQEFRADLSDSDVRDTFLQNLNVPPVITNQMIRFMEEFYDFQPRGVKGNLVLHGWGSPGQRIRGAFTAARLFSDRGEAAG